MWELIKSVFKKNDNVSTTGVSGAKTVSVIAILVNLIAAALNRYAGIVLPPEVLESLNIILGFLVAYFIRRAIPNTNV